MLMEQVLAHVEAHVSNGATLASLAQQTRLHVLQRHYEANYTTGNW